MWLKVFGLVCAGVFVGAAYREVTEHRRRERRCEGEQPCPRQDQCRHGSARTKEGDVHAPRKS